MTTSHAVDTAKTGTEKVHEKLAEKRRALGRGLESLLPGPRAVVAPTVPQSARNDEASGRRPDDANSLSSAASVSSADFADGRAGAPVSPSPSETVLDQLQAVASGRSADGETVFLLGIDQIDHNPYQTRREFDPEALKELAQSILVQGVLQPIVVRPGTEGRFILILGERRLRASLVAEKTAIPVIVKRVSEQQAAEMTLVENLQRRDLNCVEQAEAFANLSQKFMLTQEEIGKRAGISREQVSNYMRLLALPESVIGALLTGKLSYSHARTLLHLRDHSEIWRFAKRAIEERLTVQKLEDLVLGVARPPSDRAPRLEGGGARWVDPNVKAAQRALEEVLGMRVRIRDRNGRGRIVVHYDSVDDFQQVVRMLKGK
jgi:ParB family transcriptional regulator, chromosome partitioning protein